MEGTVAGQGQDGWRLIRRRRGVDHLKGATNVEERMRPEVHRAEEGISGKAGGRKKSDGVEGV